MNKIEVNKHKILEYLEENPDSSSNQISKYLGVHMVSAHRYLTSLIADGEVSVTGSTKNARYSLAIKKKNTPKELFQHIQSALASYKKSASINEENLSRLLSLVNPDGTVLDGYAAFYETTKKEYQGINPPENMIEKRLLRFFQDYLDTEELRDKDGFFDGTKSLELNLKKYGLKPSIQKLLFCEIAKLGHFGRLRTATELFYGKQSQSFFLLEKAITPSVKKIQKYITKIQPDAIIHTPPTLKREIQFRDVLRKLLQLPNAEIGVEKINSVSKILRPQKELRGYDRIINAGASITVKVPNNLTNMKRIVIFDDNFTTGATMNAITEKLYIHGYTGKITAITITGNCGYIPGDTDDGEV